MSKSRCLRESYKRVVGTYLYSVNGNWSYGNSWIGEGGRQYGEQFLH